MYQKTINIGGKDRVINFGLKAVSQIVDYEDWGFATLAKKLQNNPFVTTPVVIYFGAKNGAEANGITVDFTINDVYNWIDEKGLSNKDVIEVLQLFSESITSYVADLQGEGEAQEVKSEAKKK